jgi:hypothetical protein
MDGSDRIGALFAVQDRNIRRFVLSAPKLLPQVPFGTCLFVPKAKQRALRCLAMEMSGSVTTRAERDEILFRIISQMAT